MFQSATLALVALGLLVLSPAGAWADDRMGGGRPDSISRPHHRPHHRPPRPIARPLPIIGCCLDGGYFPPAPPVVVMPPPPPVYVIVPSPPSLFHVPTPRVEPAPEVTLPTGRWARHGNGVDYPYVWVWAGPAPTR
ncbi:MAG TPA: hypothetical protein VFR53_12935 [Methylomirabilota bacterium]|jgi:hypothetical protein|nr:hypothetical protein [Methylomirabilota bacterium]